MKFIQPARRGISSCLLLILLAAAAVGPVHAHSIVRHWARVFDSGGIDQASAIDVTPAGDVYVVGTSSSQDTTSLLLVHYSSDGTLLWSTELGTGIQLWTPRLLAADATGNAVVAATAMNGGPLDGGFVSRIRADGEIDWTQHFGPVSYPKALALDDTDRIYTAYDFDYGPLMPGVAITLSNGAGICGSSELTLGHSPEAMLVTDGTALIAGGDGYYGSSAISMLAFDSSCQLTWFRKIGLGSDAIGVSLIQQHGASGTTVFIGNIGIHGAMDVWLGFYPTSLLEADAFVSFDLAEGDDRASAAATNGSAGFITGSAEDGSIDVLVGRFTDFWDDSWWTYDGPTGGDDRGVDIEFGATGEIVVLAQVAGNLDNDQALLIFDHDGTLLDADIDTFIDNPVGLAVTSAGNIYTASYNAEDAHAGAGNIIVNKYSVLPGVGVASAETPGKLRIGSPEPNPSTGSVTIPYELPADTDVRASVYDVSGRLVRTLQAGRQPRGAHQLEWDGLTESGRPAASGAYFVRFDLGNRVERRRVVLTR